MLIKEKVEMEIKIRIKVVEVRVVEVRVAEEQVAEIPAKKAKEMDEFVSQMEILAF